MRLLLVNPAPSTSLYTFSEVEDITGRKAFMANLALPTLAALTPDPADITIIDECIEPINFDVPCDVVGITGYVTQRQRMLEIADDFRRRGKCVVIGGPYATLSPDMVRPHADVIFLGEAETTWPTFVRDFRQGKYQSEYKSDSTVDLSLSPPPDISKMSHEHYFTGNVQTSRGCPFECEFCDVIVYLGRKQRHKQPGQVVEEIDRLYRAGCRTVFLSDDNFTANRRQAAEIVRAIKSWNGAQKEQIDFITQLSVDIARDKDLPLLGLCSEAGIKQVFIGIETSSEESLLEVKKHQNVRKDLLGDIRRIQGHGIVVQAGMITGFDADSLDSFAAQYEFLQEAGIPIVLLGMLNAPDGTPLQQRLRAENRLLSPYGINDAALSTNIVPKEMSNAELLEGTAWLLNKLYAPQAFLDRIRILAGVLPASHTSFQYSAQSLAVWKKVRNAFAALGQDYAGIPVEATKLFRGKDSQGLGTALIFYLNTVRVLKKWGIWNPESAHLSAPHFSGRKGAVATYE